MRVKVRNRSTGVVGTVSKREADWLVSTGRCELVTEQASAPVETEPVQVELPTKPVKSAKVVKKSPTQKVIADVAIQEKAESAE